MLNAVDAIAHVLQGSFLEAYTIRQFAIDESDQCAFAMEVPRANALDAWHWLRSHLETTKRYPILTEGWGSDDYFARFYYQEEEQDGKLQGTSPEAIIASVPIADREAFLERRRTNLAEFLEESLDYALEETRMRFGTCPEKAEIRALIDRNEIRSTVDLEKWLFDWELQHFPDGQALTATGTSYLDWFDPGGQTATLMLLPIENGWDALAYIHWFGACTAGTTVAISFLKQWHQQYNAELVCHYGTMLQFNVGRLPATPEEAFELAWQQEALAECTLALPGISLRDHARSLLSVHRWFLHERP